MAFPKFEPNFFAPSDQTYNIPAQPEKWPTCPGYAPNVLVIPNSEVDACQEGDNCRFEAPKARPIPAQRAALGWDGDALSALKSPHLLSGTQLVGLKNAEKHTNTFCLLLQKNIVSADYLV